MPMPRDLPPADDGDDDDDHQPQQHAATAGAAADSSIVALCENRRFEIGMACFRTSDFSVELSAFCDDQAYSKCLSVLARHEPRSVLVPNGAKESVLERIVLAEYPNAQVSYVPRRTWNETKGASECTRAPGRVGGPVLVGRISVGA
jgi:hypothetical protein